jgi:hypothetical protein
MITAIFVIVLMATVAMLVLRLSSKTLKETSVQYRHEQAVLLARSYTELAVMAVTDYNRNTNGNCIESIDGVVNGIIPGQTSSGSIAQGTGYEVRTRIHYLGNNLPCSSTRILNANTIQTNYGDMGGPDALAAIIVDVYVRYKDPDAPNPQNVPWITYHRRTLQKI